MTNFGYLTKRDKKYIYSVSVPCGFLMTLILLQLKEKYMNLRDSSFITHLTILNNTHLTKL